MKAGHSAKSQKPADLLRNHLPACSGLGCRLAPEWGAELERILQFLFKEAKNLKYDTFDSVFGELCLDEIKPIKQSSGAVYGIVVKSDKPPSSGLKALKDYPNLFPIYWGKDIAPVSRIKAHVQHHASTGNANLRSIDELKEKRIIFGAIFVERYRDFEEHLHKTYPPLKGSRKHGGGEKIVKIMK